MKVRYLSFFIFFSSFILFAQNGSWNFDNSGSGLNGWSTLRLNDTYTANSVIFTTTSGNNPRIQNDVSNVDASTKTFARIVMKVSANGPTLMRIGNLTGTAQYVPVTINTGTADFVTYLVDMSDANWTNTVDSIRIQFKIDDSSSGGSNFNAAGETIEIQEISFIANPYAGATLLYVDPANGSDGAIGDSNNPLESIAYAINIAAISNISTVYVKAGTYTIDNSIYINSQATNKITVSPEPGEKVTLKMKNFRNFHFAENAKNIEIKGFELDGQSNTVEHYEILSKYVWEPQTFDFALSGGGIGFQIEEAEDIFITNNVIHDFYQKAINIENGRYVTVKGNVIYNIAKTSLSGGHGIMRQQGDGSFADPDDPNKYRWDINGNMIFNVHQRIYSWVPSKGFMNWTLDEGKSVLIDETPDHDVIMKARIQNNVVAFFKIDGIRIKPTNNLEVLNNSLYSKDSHGDGITDTANGFFGTDAEYLNFTAMNNAVEVNPSKDSYELGDAAVSPGYSASNNYSGIGGVVPAGAGTLLSTTLFKNPELGNFNLAPSGLTNVGVPSSVLTELANRAANYGISIEDDQWENDHLKNTQTLLDNIPGIEDGVPNNETVFTDAGTYGLSDLEFSKNRTAYYFTLNSAWKASKGVTDMVLDRGNGLDQYDGLYELVMPEDYQTWLEDTETDYQRDSNGDGNDDTPYDRIRYGASLLNQHKVFQPNSLHVVEIKASFDYTQTEAEGFDITLDGDILIDFEYTPAGYEVFDLIIASNITPVSATELFERIRFKNFTSNYTLQQVTEGSNEIIRLTLTDLPQPITWRDQAWSNTTGPSLITDNVLIDDDLTMSSDLLVNDIIINEGKTLTIDASNKLQVNGNLVNSGTIVFKSDASGTAQFDTFNGALTGEGKVTVERFIPLGKRAFRMLTPSVNTTDFIADNWQQGTQITGSLTGANGFDTSGSGNPSMFLFNNEQTTGSGWDAIESTNTTRLNAGQGYRIMIRGDRTLDLTQPALANMNTAVVLPATGTMVTGDITFDTSSSPPMNNTTNPETGGFSFIGNPYISPVNWNTVTRTGLTNTYYVWDPNMGTASESGRYVAYNGITNDNPSSNVSEFIQTGQALFVHNSTLGTAGAITFKESDKADNYVTVFSTSSLPKLTVELNDVNSSSSNNSIDGTTAIFGNQFSYQNDAYDSNKLQSPGENLAWNTTSNQLLAINALPEPVDNDELLLHMLRINSGSTYSFKIKTENMNSNLSMYLLDNFDNSMTTVPVNSTFIHDFTTTSNIASVDTNRFKIIFNTTLSVDHFVNNDVALYPNPTSGNSNVSIRFSRPIIGEPVIEVYNLIGQKIDVTSQQTSSSSLELNPTAALKTGTYIIKVNIEGQSQSMKWIIQ
ncbi:MAG: T9SS type A sorting domain-containing protein [Nonlabens sp.]|uniref:T9SS type A sorting domain-containing protein n=1 Tax=Nonlabens sp. TaxID=1888209 RepID=UPI003EF21FF1